MKIKEFTKPMETHMKKLGLPYNPESLKKECEEYIALIYEDKVATHFNEDTDAVFIDVLEVEDFEKANKLADEGHSVTIRFRKDRTAIPDALEKFEAVIIDADDLEKYDLGIKNLYVAFEHKPTKIELDLVFDYVKDGKIQIVNLSNADMKRPNVRGFSPATGALLDSYGSIHISTVDVSKFIVEGTVIEEDGTETPTIAFDSQGLIRAQALSTRANARKLLAKTNKELAKIKMRDTVMGVSLKGVKETAEKLGWDDNQVDALINTMQEIAHTEAMNITGGLRLPLPMSVTTVDYGEAETFEEYVRYQKFYTDQNTPCTITMKEEEIESYKELILENWEWFISIDFKVIE